MRLNCAPSQEIEDQKYIHIRYLSLLSASMHRTRNRVTLQVKHGRHTRGGYAYSPFTGVKTAQDKQRSCTYVSRVGILIIFSH